MALPPLARQLAKTRAASQTLRHKRRGRLPEPEADTEAETYHRQQPPSLVPRGVQGRSAWGPPPHPGPAAPPNNAVQARRVPSRPHTHTCRQRDRTVTTRSEGQRGRCPFCTGWAAWTPGRRAAAPGGAVSRLGRPNRDKPRSARDSPRDTGEVGDEPAEVLLSYSVVVAARRERQDGASPLVSATCKTAFGARLGADERTGLRGPRGCTAASQPRART